MFCPTCDTLLAPSEEEDKLMEKCSMCGFKQENDKLVIKTTNDVSSIGSKTESEF